MRKRMIAVALTGMMAVSLAGCGGKEGAADSAAATTAASTAAETTAATTAAETEAATAEESTVEETTETTAKTEASGGTFTVGFDQDFPPMGFVGDDGEYTGFDLDLAKEVATRLGLEFVPQPIAWDAKDMELDAGTIDCIWNGFTINGREDGYTWSDPYMKNQQVFVVKKDSGITAFADLSGKVVEVQADSSAEAALKDKPDLTASFGTLQTTPDYNTAFMDLEMGAVDAVAMDEIVAAYQIENRKAEFIILDEALSAEEYGVGFKKGNTELRDKVQSELEAMAADGTLEKISMKWFGRDVTTVGK